MFKKALLYPIPLTLFMALYTSGALTYKLNLSGTGTLFALIICLLFSMIMIAIPILLALYSDTKYKALIIVLDVMSFLPFGIVLYIISVILGVIELVKHGENVPTKKNKTKK